MHVHLVCLMSTRTRRCVGPEAFELCCYFGVLSRGRLGAIVAGFGFMLPGLAFMLLLSWIYTSYGVGNVYFEASFQGTQQHARGRKQRNAGNATHMPLRKGVSRA